MPTKLEEICATKRAELDVKMRRMPLSELKIQAEQAPPVRCFKTALEACDPAIIAEVKKASPSKGIIREDFDPLEIARTYEKNGAACLSVLTDTPYFMGEDACLSEIRAFCGRPLLRKDFMIDPWQIYESRALGADCVLLIVAALDQSLYLDLYRLAWELGMQVLVETHDEAEIVRAMEAAPDIVGINARNLKTLEVDPARLPDLAERIPHGPLKIAESGITSPEHLVQLKIAGFDGFLIGETLMRAPDIGRALRSFLNG